MRKGGSIEVSPAMGAVEKVSTAFNRSLQSIFDLMHYFGSKVCATREFVNRSSMTSLLFFSFFN